MVYDLMDADDITIFGHSLGINDSQYFKAFFFFLKDNLHPLIPKRRILQYSLKTQNRKLR